ncbi:VgrG-related protein [Streptomyces sp. 7-21]|jgi:phage protein D|uniref:VgrG-related protein n=1 Tax=Streptomyces sp. 7-21 TaxID=2802283 RepID=UPI00191D299C|nr:VgrG-related protein [Streptomyces sp. 7-21]MBL1068015.1 VgrG-related protein [Streptomyces sp. 7-21]
MSKITYSSVLQITINGDDLPPDCVPLLTDGWVDQGVGVPAAFRLTFRDPLRRILGLLNVEFGSPVTIAPVAAGQGAADPLLTGEVTGMEADYDGTGSFAVIRGYDNGFRLMRRRRVAAYRNQTASDIARKLAGEAGVPVGRVDPTGAPYDFISQPNITDWDFLARLAEENEMVMSIDAQGKLQFIDPRPASGAPSPKTDADSSFFVLSGKRDILRLRAAVTAADQVSQVEARGWDVTRKQELTATADVLTTPGVDIGITPGEAAKSFRGAKLVETDTPYDRPGEVTRAAAALADDVTSSFAELEVVARGNPRLRPGVPVALSHVGKPFEGKYTTTSVRHTFGDGRHYEAWVSVTGRQWRSLYGLASGGAVAQSSPRLPSVANALVTDVQDPLKQGRVKLKFPWLDDSYVSDWTRVMQWGGKGGGGIFPLDVGDEVLVAFDRGALDHPFVIGGLYNGQDKPTRVKDVPLHDGLRNRSARHTLADRTGNRLDLLSQRSGARKQGVRLATGDGKLVINLDRTKTEITVDSDGAVSISGGRSVSVKAGTDLELSAGGRLSLRAGGLLEMQSTGLINLRSLAGLVTVNATSGVNLTASNIGLNGVVLVRGKPLPMP